MTVTERGDDFAAEVGAKLKGAGIRVEVDIRNEKLGYKIREAQLNKIPYMLVVGDREVEDKTVSPRLRGNENLDPMSVDKTNRSNAETIINLWEVIFHSKECR